MNKLVSIIIPCFNAEQWLTEAIDSCLHQTYPQIEIVVIDDGSTDNSLQIIQSYGDRIIWETGRNQGGNYARNRGFALSTGDYIQYLDADDYLFPDKIKKQVEFLEATTADIVYSNLTYQHHLTNGIIVREDANLLGIPAPHEDVLECLLIYGNLSPSPYLFRRKIIQSSPGWDEGLKASQDRDFLISLLLNGAKIAYQPGYYSVYRRYGNVTVSTADKTLLWKSSQAVLEKAEAKLTSLDRLYPKYHVALAKAYCLILGLYHDRIDCYSYCQLVGKILHLYPQLLLTKTFVDLGKFNKNIHLEYAIIDENPSSDNFTANQKC